MASIFGTSAHIPYMRLPRKAIGDAWNRGAPPGSKAVANMDEDSLTMAVQAAMALVNGDNRADIGALYFASTSSPFKVKKASALIAEVLGLDVSTITADISGSFSAGTSALRMAADAVDSGRISNAMVVAGETVTGKPASADENMFGDGACALLIGKGGGGLEILAAESIANSVVDKWQNSDEKYPITWEGRFSNAAGYVSDVGSATELLLEKSQMNVGDINTFIFSSSDFKSPSAVLKKLGVDPKENPPSSCLKDVGYTGTADPLLNLAAALPHITEGSRVILAGQGDGCDALLLKAEAAGAMLLKGTSVEDQLRQKKEISYTDYLRHKDILDNAITDFPQGYSSSPRINREKNALLLLHTHKCNSCGTIQYPTESVCYQCRKSHDFSEVPIALEKSTLFTFTRDHLFQGGNPPQVMAVVDTESGCRLYLQMTDCDPANVQVGMDLEFTLRLLHKGSGFNNYFWKCRPALGKGGR